MDIGTAQNKQNHFIFDFYKQIVVKTIFDL